jgi:tetratricopeptide (TPR) repeat protein
MSSAFRIVFLLVLSLCFGFLCRPSFAVYAGINSGALDHLEQLRFGHTNRDLRTKERLDVLEWSVMGGRQSGSMGERLAEVQQKIDSEGSDACINTVGPTYNVLRPRTGYLAGRYAVRKSRKVRSKVIVIASAPVTKSAAKAKVTAAPKTAALPKAVDGLVKKGNDLYISGNYRKSVQELTRAIELNPSYAPAYVSRGYAYGKLGQADMKKSDFKLAKRLDSRIQLPM